MSDEESEIVETAPAIAPGLALALAEEEEAPVRRRRASRSPCLVAQIMSDGNASDDSLHSGSSTLGARATALASSAAPVAPPAV